MILLKENMDLNIKLNKIKIFKNKYKINHNIMKKNN